MRLQTAIAIDEIEGLAGDDFSGFEGPEERAERRARRQSRRKNRRQRRGKRKLSRVSRKKARLQDKAGSPRKQQRGGRKAGRGGAAASEMSPTAMPDGFEPMDPDWEDEACLEPAPMDWPEDDPEVLDAEWSELDAQMEEDLDGEMEGIGAFKPLRRLGQGVRTATQRVRAKAQARRTSRQAAPASPAGWGPKVRMGRHLRIQAAAGHRAAVIDLKPGLYLVAELPEAVTRTEFGIAPLLAPLMVRAAKKALDGPQEGQPRRGPLAALFRRRQAGGPPVRLFRAREAQPVAVNAPKALPGPVAAPSMQPAQGAGAGSTFLLPAPNVGWADERDVAEVLGCEACEEGWR